MDLNYHHLRLFQAVARAGSVSAAARELHLTPQTVSQQVRALEEALDTVLLERAGRGVAVTETGRLVAGYADDIFERGRELLEVVRERTHERRLRVVVGISDVMPKMIVRHLLEPLLVGETRIHVTCREDRTQRLLAALAVHELDVVLSDAPAPARLRVRTYDHLLGSCGVDLVAPARMAKALRAGFPGSLDGAPMLLPTPGTVLRGLLEEWFDRHDVYPVVVAEFDDSALASEIAAGGSGALAVPAVISEETRRRHGLHPVGALDGVTEQFYAISPERRVMQPAVRMLLDSARSELFSAS